MTNIDRAALKASRVWEQYLVKAVFDSSTSDWPERSEAEIRTHEQDLNRGYECQLFALPSPIAVSRDLKRIINVSVGQTNLRIYPPFVLNEKKHASGSFAEVAIPEGTEAVESATTIPNDVVTGVRAAHGMLPNGIWARGLRIDIGTNEGPDTQVLIGKLLDHICQFTHQWWIRETHNPFLGFVRLGAAVDQKFQTRRLFGYQGAKKVESPWYGAVRFQPALGPAALLEEKTWLLIGHHLSQGNRADVGTLGVHEAVADYMAGRDERCILTLCIAIEIMLNKHWQAILKKPGNDSLDKIVRKTTLIDEDTRESLKKLIVDRGHVAHGRAPHFVGKSPKCTIETYLAAGKTVLEKYLKSIPLGEWPKLMTMTLNRTTD
jgi:hypothetical protein